MRVRIGLAMLFAAAGRLEGRIGFDADILPYAEVATLRGGGLELVPPSGVVAALREADGS